MYILHRVYNFCTVACLFVNIFRDLMTFHFATLNSYIRSPTLRVLMTFYLRDFMSVQFWHKVANAPRPYDIFRSRPYDILILTQGRQRSATFWHFSFATLCQSHSDIKSPTLRDLMTFFVRDLMSVQFWHKVAKTCLATICHKLKCHTVAKFFIHFFSRPYVRRPYDMLPSLPSGQTCPHAPGNH